MLHIYSSTTARSTIAAAAAAAAAATGNILKETERKRVHKSS